MSEPCAPYTAEDRLCSFSAVPLKRRAPGDYDVVIKMKYCGVCHSDVHNAAGQTARAAVQRTRSTSARPRVD